MGVVKKDTGIYSEVKQSAVRTQIRETNSKRAEVLCFEEGL